MSRLVLLVVSLVFTSAIAVLTVQDIIANGIDIINLVAVVIVVMFATGVIGALLHKPPPGD